MTNIFTYGSLMFPEVIYQLLTQRQYSSCKGVLHDFVRRQVKNKVYPGAKQQQGGIIQGVIYFDLTEDDVKILDDFEEDEYKKTKVEIITQKGKFQALVYEYIDYSNLIEYEWNMSQFQQKSKATFAKSHSGVIE